MDDHPTPAPNFAVGASVTVKSTGRQGTVILHTRRDGRWLVLVDQPHGLGTLRQHYTEEELE